MINLSSFECCQVSLNKLVSKTVAMGNALYDQFTIPYNAWSWRLGLIVLLIRIVSNKIHVVMSVSYYAHETSYKTS